MPWLEANPKRIVLSIADIYVAEVFKSPANFGGGKALRKIGRSESNLSYVKIANAVKRIARRSQ